MRIRIVILTILYFFVTFTSSANAAQCPTTNPLSTKIWRDFDQFVKEEYTRPVDYSRARPLAYGHALGRLAIAVQGDLHRARQFACVQLVFETIIAKPVCISAR